MSGLSFAHPWLLWGLLLLPLYAFLRRRALVRDAVPYAPLQYRRPRTSRRHWTRLLLPLETLLVATAIVGLAGPYQRSELELIEEEGIDVVLVLDVSLSMLAEDFPPNRLEALRRIAGDFVARSGGHRIGMVIFAKDAYVQSPLTTDRHALGQLLESVTVYALDQDRSGGTAIGDALLVAAERLERARVPGRDQAVVLITDGESNSGASPELAARYLRHLGVRFYAIGIGSEEPVPVFFEGNPVGRDGPYRAYLDETELRAMAAAAEGRLWRATDVGALEEIFAHLSRLESAPLEVRTLELRERLDGWLAAAALPLFAACLALAGVILRRPLR